VRPGEAHNSLQFGPNAMGQATLQHLPKVIHLIGNIWVRVFFIKDQDQRSNGLCQIYSRNILSLDIFRYLPKPTYFFLFTDL
jgi:hypothetical protein